MTAAFNLSQLANNLNSSGQLDATDGLSGLVTNANLASSGTADSSTFLRGDRTWAGIGTVGKVLQQKTSFSTTKFSVGATLGTYYENTSSTQGIQVASVTMTRLSATSTILVWGNSAGQVGGNDTVGCGLYAGTTRLAMSLSNGYAGDAWGCNPHAAIASSVVGSGAVVYQFRILGARNGYTAIAYQYSTGQNMGDFYSGISVMEIEV